MIVSCPVSGSQGSRLRGLPRGFPFGAGPLSLAAPQGEDVLYAFPAGLARTHLRDAVVYTFCTHLASAKPELDLRAPELPCPGAVQRKKEDALSSVCPLGLYFFLHFPGSAPPYPSLVRLLFRPFIV